MPSKECGADPSIRSLILAILPNIGYKAVEKIKSAIYEFERLSKENGFDLLVVVHPTLWEVKFEKYLSNFNHLVAELEKKQDINFIDLLEHYRANNLITKENFSDFFWRINEHHNTKGYEVMGKAIADKILELQIIRRDISQR